MKSYTYSLTSEPLSPILPSVLDHWFITDPFYGSEYSYTSAGAASAVNWFYPATANGDFFTGVPETSATYQTGISGGFFFPWGYQTVNQHQDILLPDFKGDLTLTFNPSNIDISQHDVLKFIYEPGNSGKSITVGRDIIPDFETDNYNNFIDLTEPNSPTLIPVSFVYYASSGPLTYYPSITALFGDLTQVTYKFQFTQYPGSIYEIADVHLIGSTQLPNLSSTHLTVLEVESLNALTLVELNDADEDILTLTLSDGVLLTEDGFPLLFEDGFAIELEGF